MLAHALACCLQCLRKTTLSVNATRYMMTENVYMIAYDLLGEERDDAALEKMILAYRAKKQKLMHRAWLVKTTETEEALYNKVCPYLEQGDRCIIFLVSRSHWVARLPRILQKVTLWMAM